MRLVQDQFQRHGKAVIASLLACLVLLLDAMVVSPSLHEHFHADAGKTGHACAVTMFAHGQVDAAGVETLPVISLNLVEAFLSPVISTYAPAIEYLPSGRAPPVSTSNS